MKAVVWIRDIAFSNGQKGFVVVQSVKSESDKTLAIREGSKWGEVADWLGSEAAIARAGLIPSTFPVSIDVIQLSIHRLYPISKHSQ